MCNSSPLLSIVRSPEVPAKGYVYSPDGTYFAYAIPGRSVRRRFPCSLPADPRFLSVKIFTSNDAELYKELPITTAVEIKFSPLGTFLSTWERLGEFCSLYLAFLRLRLTLRSAKLEDGAQHKNLRIWSLSTGDEVASFTQKSQEGW